MTTQEVANRLVEMCRQGQILEAQAELFADDVTSQEPPYAPMPRAEGKAAVMAKGKQFAAMIKERHSGSFSDPIVAADYFSIVCKLDATMQDGSRMNMDEICVFGVKNGKIVSEQFWY